MIRLYLTVEGQTEQTFATRILRPHLSKFKVMVVKPLLTGPHRRKAGRTPQGGMSKFRYPLQDIRNLLRQEANSSDVRFSTMIDFYSLPTDFPGYDEAMKLDNPYKKVENLEDSLKEVLKDERFIPYLQLHEFEALVLSDLSTFRDYSAGFRGDYKKLAEECESYESPELINDGKDSHPKARIEKYVRDYRNIVDGSNITEAIGLQKIRDKCSHFNRWLTTLESLGN